MKVILLVSLLTLVLFNLPSSFSQTESTIGSLAEEIVKSESIDDRVKLLLYTNTEWKGEVQDGNYITHNIQGTGNELFFISCGETNTISVTVNSENGEFDIYLIKESMILSYSENVLFFQESALNCSKTGVFQEQSPNSPIFSNSEVKIIAGIIVIAVIIIGAYILLNYKKII